MKRLIYILLVVNIILVAVFHLSGQNDEGERSGAIYVSHENTEDVQKIEVILPDEEYIFEFNGEWSLAGHPEVKLNQAAVGELAYDTAVISALEIVEKDTEDVEKYGAVFANINVTYADGNSRMYALGDKTFNSNRYYFYSVTDNTVYAITAQKKEALFKPLNEYREIRALTCDENSIAQIKAGNLTVEKRGGNYVLVSPCTAYVMESRVRDFLYRYFGEVSGKNIVKNREGMQECMQISISDTYGVRNDFKLFLNEGSYYLYIADENVTVKIGAGLENIDVWTFADKRIFPDDIKSAVMSFGDTEYILAPEDIDNLCKIEVVDFGEPTTEKAVATVKAEGDMMRIYEIYEYNSRYVLVDDGFGKYLVNTEKIDFLFKKR